MIWLRRAIYMIFMMNEDKYTVSKVILYSERLPFYFTIGNVLLSSINNACQGKIKVRI